MTAVIIVYGGQIEFVEYVCIDDPKRMVVPEIHQVFNGAPGSQKLRFAADMNWNRIGLLSDETLDGIVQVVGIHGDGLAAQLLESPNMQIQ